MDQMLGQCQNMIDALLEIVEIDKSSDVALRERKKLLNKAQRQEQPHDACCAIGQSKRYGSIVT